MVVHEYRAAFVTTGDPAGAATFGGLVTTGPPARPAGSMVPDIE